MSEAVTADRVGFSYGSNQVISDLSFEVEEGEILGIIGMNGSGKTTLLRLIAGWLEPDDGEIRVFDRSVGNLSGSERAKTIGLLSQSVEFAFDTGVLEMVLLGRSPYLGRFEEVRPHDIEVAQWAMEMTDTWEFREKPVSSLSAGERQRILIARSIAQSTPILLLDEPTSNLDIAHQRMVMDNISWMQKEKNTTVLFVSHDVNLTCRYADRILLLGEGKRIAWGPGSEVLTRGNLRDTFGVDLVIEERAGRKIILEWENGETHAPWEQ